MNKLFAAAAAALAATAMLAPAAEAGFKIRLGFGGPLPAFTAYGNSGGSYQGHYARKRHAQPVRRYEKAPTRVVKKAAPSSQNAKADVESEPKQEVAAVTENSSITTAQPTVAAVKTDAAVQTAATPSAKIDCKKFFPSVGMTLSVPCE